MSDQNQQQGYEDGYAGHVDSNYLDKATHNQIEIKQQTYSMMRVQEGQSVLDVGCGPASDTIALSKIVGATGKVTGIDHDPDMVSKANQRAVDAGVADYVEHRQADGLELPFEDNIFDSCRSERVFQHVPEAEQLLAEMIRVTKPGGYVVIADTDHSTHGTSTQFVEMDMRIRKLALDVLKNPQVARRLSPMMAVAGLQDIEVKPIILSWNDYDQWYQVGIDIAVQAGLEMNVFTKEEIDQHLNYLKRLSEQGIFYANFVYYLIAGRKPE